MVCECALLLALEPGNVKAPAGVHTPASLGLPIVDRLVRTGCKFSVELA